MTETEQLNGYVQMLEDDQKREDEDLWGNNDVDSAIYQDQLENNGYNN